ncbi:MAG: hypothetical protein HZA52_18945 [Planctomycetes bacterium]|nr:hypothetical protein [Planctomycetota bacterium]
MTHSTPIPSPLDAAVDQARASLALRGVPAPEALFWPATGTGILPGRLTRGGKLPFSRVDGVPRAWRDSVLAWGDFHGLAVWMLDDAPLEAIDGEAPWMRSFPVWLAAASGATALMHASAGVALERNGRELAVGSLAFFSDHLNLSGSSPLIGIGESQLGPMFPDQTRVHDPHLRRAALAAAERLGVAAAEAVVACTAGPTLDTPAERRFFARAGADVAVQDLAGPLIAAAHSGLGALGVGVIVARERDDVDVARIASLCQAVAPALDDLFWQLAADVQKEIRARLDEDLA